MNPPDSRVHTGSSLAAQLALVFAVLLAWLPMLGSAIPVADDYAYFQLSSGGLSAYLRVVGAWRPLGAHLPAALWHIHPALPVAFILLIHVIASLLLYHAARCLMGGCRLPLVLALIFGTFPFGYQALLWVIASNYLIAVAFFLANVVLLQSAKPRPRTIGLSAGLALASALSNECLLLSTVVAGALALPRSRALALAPATGSIIWLALYWLGGSSSGRIINFNQNVIISTYWHQYSLLDVFEPWGSAYCRGLLFSGWTPLLCTAVALCAIGAIWSARSLPMEVPVPKSSWVTLGVIVALLVGLSAIFALGGGYSLDARKKYAVLPLLLLALGWGWRCYAFRFSRRFLPTVLSATVGFGIVTTWLVIGIWKHEVPIYAHLADELAAHNVTSVAIVRQPDIHSEWRTFTRSLGFRLDDSWVLSLTLRSHGASPVKVSADAPIIATFEPPTNTWELRPRSPR